MNEHQQALQRERQLREFLRMECFRKKGMGCTYSPNFERRKKITAFIIKAIFTTY